MIKGVYTADDARRAVDEGAAGIVVSNHGGRQLDGVAAAGTAGAARSIEILRDELIRTCKLLGVSSIDGWNGSLVEIPSSWRR